VKLARSLGLTVALVTLGAVAVSGCSVFSGLRGGPKRESRAERGNDVLDAQLKATEGQRIPLLALDQQLNVSPTLKGTTFYIPPAKPQADCPLPGCTPEQALENVEAAPSFRIAWRRNIGRGSARTEQVTAPPILAEGRVFTMDGNATVQATDARTGAKVWIANLAVKNKRDAREYGGGLAYADGKIFVASGYRFVAAVDAKTGRTLWKTMTKLPFHTAPTVADGRVIVSTVSDDLESFDVATGQAGWTYQALVEPATLLEASSPAVINGTVIAAFSSGELSAVQAANGNQIWTQSLTRISRTSALSEIRDIAGRPVIYKGQVFSGSHSGVVASVDLRTGEPKWQLPIITMATPWVSGDVVYFVSKAGEVICAARESGQVYWIRDLNEGKKQLRETRFLGREVRDRAYWTGVVMASNRLITVSSDGRAAWLDPQTGEVKSYLKLGKSPALITPMVAGGMIYVVTDKAELIAIN
jgi:outer membrane protein assembly factor BamB